MANEVVYYSSDETGAPILNNANGAMINVLDACLINGFNAKSVTSLIVAGAVATATISAHGYLTGRIVEFTGSSVTGGTPGALNGNQKITVVDANTVTFPAPGIADQTAAGTITCKRPGLGFVKEYSGTNKAIYKRTHVQATAMMLRVDDTGSGVASATLARALMVESATGIDTYTNHTPTTAQLSGGQYWSKGANDSSTKQWILVGDGRTFYFWTEHGSQTFAGTGALHMRMFGDITSYRAGDAYGCAIGGDFDTSGSSFLPFGYSAGSVASNGIGFLLARMSDTISYAIGAAFTCQYASAIVGNSGPSYPSPVDNGLALVTKPILSEVNATFSHPIRGHARGLMLPIATVGNRLHKRTLTGLTYFDGEVLMVANVTTGQPGSIGVDITGPWA